MSESVKILSECPSGFLDLEPNQLYKVIHGPTIIHLKGKEKNPLFVSTLLHGNETTGVRALQKLIKHHKENNRPFLRDLVMFIGNVEAAKQNKRLLESQKDFNRLWDQDLEMVRSVKNYVESMRPIAAIDIHNTTGRNPLYACVAEFGERSVSLAQLFSRTLVFFESPTGTITEAMSKICPSITIECGQSDNQMGIEKAYELLESCLHIPEIPQVSSDKQHINIFRSKARIVLPEGASVEFTDAESKADYYFSSDWDRWNFSEVEAGTLIGKTNKAELFLKVLDRNNQDVFNTYFRVEGSDIKAAKKIYPSLLTTDPEIAKEDCLGYMMEPFPAV